jgi:CheY-like chemotaxis protein
LKKEAINANIVENDCEIIALTSFTDKSTYDTCIEIGIKEVINKPIHHQELLRIILKYFFKLTNAQYKYYLELHPESLNK